MALRWHMSRRFRVLTSGRMISNLPAEQLNRCPIATKCPRWLKTSLVNRQREEPDNQWKAAAFAWWHEPDDARVSRPDVCPGKASVFSRRQTCRGKSQAPRSSDG